jgi:lysylphosphatidylglycerol synthetase-like protein (DUF2156 family)
MRKVKITFWVIILGFLTVLFYQNKDYFLSGHSLGIDLYFTQKTFPNLPNAVLFAVFFGAGWLIAYFFSLLNRYKASKTIKALKAEIASNQDSLAQVKREVEALKPVPDESVPEMPDGATGEHSSPGSDAAQPPQSTP